MQVAYLVMVGLWRWPLSEVSLYVNRAVAAHDILYYPGVCCPSISQVSRQAKLSLISCISVSSDYQLQELGLQLQLGNTYLQTQDADYSIFSRAHN